MKRRSGTAPSKRSAATHATAGPHPTLDCVIGCFLSGALGDALGYPVEFLSRKQIVRSFGSAPPASLLRDRSGVALVSDDTQMTLFTAEGLIRARQRALETGVCDPVPTVYRALQRWYATQTGTRGGDQSGWLFGDRRLHDQRAPGNTCMSALAFHRGRLPTVRRPPNVSKGCGAVMRAAPCGLAARSREDAFRLARDTSVLTHGHPSAYLSAAYLASVVWDCARGGSVGDAMDCADVLLAAEKRAGELATLLRYTRKLARRGPPGPRTIEQLGSGWDGHEALAIALLCALTFDPTAPRAVESALWKAAAHSGDSDSTAAVTGNILGATVGARALPRAWLRTLELRDTIEHIGRDFHQCVILDRALEGETYPPN